ncbi:MAG: zf-HC2 domain-containing protein [Clostridia bacterium]|nr:zf-HC2 domain-containing protein [Clostridia bacterium]
MKTITCDEYRALLDRLLDGETLSQEEEDAMRTHEASCEECALLREALTLQEKDLAALAEETPPMPEDLHARWMAAVEADAAERKNTERRTSRGWTRWLSVAAALVLVLGGTLLTRDRLPRRQALRAQMAAEIAAENRRTDPPAAARKTTAAPIPAQAMSVPLATAQPTPVPVPESEKAANTVPEPMMDMAMEEPAVEIAMETEEAAPEALAQGGVYELDEAFEEEDAFEDALLYEDAAMAPAPEEEPAAEEPFAPAEEPRTAEQVPAEEARTEEAAPAEEAARTEEAAPAAEGRAPAAPHTEKPAQSKELPPETFGDFLRDVGDFLFSGKRWIVWPCAAAVCIAFLIARRRR